MPTPYFFRMTVPVSVRQKRYYRFESFGQIGETVNLGSPNNKPSGVNGLVARYQACASTSELVGDGIPFPHALTAPFTIVQNGQQKKL